MTEPDAQTAVAPVPRPVLGTLGRYVLRRELASGGMATVYLAHLSGPHGFEKAVALKQIHPHLAKDRRFVEMFLDEARVAGLIHHPNVCTLVDFGEQDGVPYLVLEYLNGEPMSSVVEAARATGDAPVWLFARIVHDAARGLHAAHQLAGPDGRPLGVVHRDVSPQNIFVLYDGLTKVVDFGVSRARGRLSVTQSNELKGKLAYMSPEQFDSGPVDHRTDIWALGVVLWESTVGRRLFRVGSDAATMAAVLHKPVPRPSEFVPDYPPELEAIVLRCLERDVARRFDTSEHLADALEEYLYSLGRPVGASQVKRWMHEHFDVEIAHRAALLRGESPQPLPNRYTGTTVVASRPDEPMREPTESARAEVPTVFVRRRSTNEPSDETPLVEASASLVSPLARDLEPHASATQGAASLGVANAGARTVSAAGPRTRRGLFAIALVLVLASLGAAGLYLGVRGTSNRAVTEGTRIRAERGAVTTHPASAATTPRTVVPPTSSEAVSPAPQAAVTVDAGTLIGTEVPGASRVRSTSTQTRSAASVARGRLNLMAVPTARVRIDGRSVGETPLLGLELAAGEHRVELVTADGRSRVLVLRVNAGEVTRQSVRF